MLFIFIFYIALKHINKYDFDSFPKDQLTNVEADSFWCLTILLDGIQVCEHLKIDSLLNNNNNINYL